MIVVAEPRDGTSADPCLRKPELWADERREGGGILGFRIESL